MLVYCTAIAAPHISWSQHISITRESATDTREVYVLEAIWPNSLGAAVDSLGAGILGESELLALSGGGVTERTAFVQLPTLALPTVTVLSSTFDAITLPADTSASRFNTIHGPAAEIGALGWERKKPAATLAVRTLQYDVGTNTLRRYRQVRVALDMDTRARDQLLVAPKQHATTQSVLASGTVFKLAITEEGVYRIDRDFLTTLPGLDRDPGSIDPDNIQIFGNGGAPLPALNSAERAEDLVENQVIVMGGGDGSFDAEDAVLFYGAPPSGWRYALSVDSRGRPITDENGEQIYSMQHYVNPFSNENYYFVRIDGGNNQPMQQKPFAPTPGSRVLRQIIGRYFVDMDNYMWTREPGGTGHTWVSNLITGSGAELSILDNLELPNLVNGTVRYVARPAVQSNPATDIFFVSGSTTLTSANLGAVASTSTTVVARSRIVEFEQAATTGQALSVLLRLGSQDANVIAALDWMRVFYPKSLQATPGGLRFHSPAGQSGAFEAVLTGFGTEPYVIDITNTGSFLRLGVQQVNNAFHVPINVLDETEPRELIAFVAADARSIDIEEACGETCLVSPQNLHGAGAWPQFLIVAPDILLPHANELAAMRREEGLTVGVVDVEHIFNEFGGGLRDFRAIRDYLKFLYDGAPTDEQRLLYVLFFGDGHFNYRNVGPEPPAIPNLIPPFQTVESWYPEETYTTDDYFGLLDDNEGEWPFTRYTFGGSNEHLNERVDLGVGRITVYSVEQAQAVLEKLQHYASPASFGAWRQRYLFVADDGPTGAGGQQNDQDLHTQNTDVVAETVRRQAPEINQEKVYAISYAREFRNTWRVPGARHDLLSAIRSGVLMVNYSGHGGEEGLAQENLFHLSDAQALDNRDALPIFVTATCSFGRWDLSNEQSGAEELLLNPDGGAIALLTTVRSVYTSGNSQSLNVGLNVALNDQLFQPDDQGNPRRIGDALRLTKNTRVGFEGNNRKFNLLGDPTMRIGTADRRAAITDLGGRPFSDRKLQLSALDRTTIRGEIRSPSGTVDTGFNGTVSLTVYDAERRVAIPPDMRRYMPRPYYTVREDLIWRGRTAVEGGRFEATFVVPKDISYSDMDGRITAYSTSGNAHAHGFTEKFVVGGTAANIPDDTDGPAIEVFLGDEAFTSGQLTVPNPEVLVKLFDESGINTVGAGVGHEMLLIVDGDEENAVNIGGFYESDEDSYQKGRVRYAFSEDLDPGTHNVEVRAWDVLNNSTREAVEFVVTESEALQIRNTLNYPNPTLGPTRFVFEHNQPAGTPVTARIRIYSLAGRPVRTIETIDFLPGGAMHLVWDGTDDEYVRLPPGVYLYKLRVAIEGADGESQVAEAIERLAIVR